LAVSEIQNRLASSYLSAYLAWSSICKRLCRRLRPQKSCHNSALHPSESLLLTPSVKKTSACHRGAE
jgi:hypothetical protein